MGQRPSPSAVGHRHDELNVEHKTVWQPLQRGDDLGTRLSHARPDRTAVERQRQSSIRVGTARRERLRVMRPGNGKHAMPDLIGKMRKTEAVNAPIQHAARQPPIP